MAFDTTGRGVFYINNTGAQPRVCQAALNDAVLRMSAAPFIVGGSCAPNDQSKLACRLFVLGAMVKRIWKARGVARRQRVLYACVAPGLRCAGPRLASPRHLASAPHTPCNLCATHVGAHTCPT